MPCASKNHNFVPDRSVFKIRFKNLISIEYIARRKMKLTPNLGEIKKNEPSNKRNVKTMSGKTALPHTAPSWKALFWSRIIY